MPSISKILEITTAGIFCCSLLTYGGLAYGQQNAVSAHVRIREESDRKVQKRLASQANLRDVVLWLKPLDRAAADTHVEPAPKKFQLTQKNKSFQPHVLVVPVGSVVDFPNRDPFFHNVFSLFDGKRFDLGLYEAGTTNSVRFDRAGVSFLFCNIHPEMSAVVVAVDTPYYGVSDPSGNITILDVPDGEYDLHVWYERSLAEDLKSLTRSVNVSAVTKDLGEMRIPENPHYSSVHKNKYGQDYIPAPSSSYSHP